MERIFLSDSYGIMEFEKDDDGTYISYFINGFYVGQTSVWDNLKRKIEIIWSVLTNKEYRLYEVVLTGENEHDFERKMLKFLER